MRINQFVAQATGLSRRAADAAIAAGRVSLNGQTASLGLTVTTSDDVRLDEVVLRLQTNLYIAFHKPAGYVTSRRRQGSHPTIYKLLPPKLHHLKPVGRLDRESEGLLILTNDGALANRLTHPRHHLPKHYSVTLSKPLAENHRRQLQAGVMLTDGPSRLGLTGQNRRWQVSLSEGRNRQIRRSFAKLGYTVVKLKRLSIGSYQLGSLQPGRWQEFKP